MNPRSAGNEMKGATGMQDALERGRDAYARCAWAEAFRAFADADTRSPLQAEDLERWANSAYLLGREDDFATLLDRAHHANAAADDPVRAARNAFWIGLSLLLRGQPGRATGWLARAQRLVEGRDCVEQGYLLVPASEGRLHAGDETAAHEIASRAVSLGERFEDRDLIACARHMQGRALLQGGRTQEGLAMLDEAMVAVTAGELSPLFTGLIYCSVIDACQQSYALGRAREWTAALARWCEGQPELVAFTATCLVRRAEVLQQHGAWPDAIEEAKRACARVEAGSQGRPPAAAFYQQGEVHRLRGEFEAAEQAYRRASEAGLEPQPGLALLRQAQGRHEAAAAAIRRTLDTTTERRVRARLLPAAVEIALAAGDREAARTACEELEEIARSFPAEALTAMAAQARGTLGLEAGDARAALRSLRGAWELWQRLEVPYAAARVRETMGRACRALGDDDGASLEFAAARAEYGRLGAAHDLARLEESSRAPGAPRAHGLTRRELEVLRLVATGRTNKAIAAELFLSEKTVDRHVSNILAKLDVPSRAAATAYGYEHKLI